MTQTNSFCLGDIIPIYNTVEWDKDPNTDLRASNQELNNITQMGQMRKTLNGILWTQKQQTALDKLLAMWFIYPVCGR